jgi:predicted HicB family RNase H-like nuclease
VNEKKQKLKNRVAELEAKEQLTPEEESELEEKQQLLEELENDEPEVRVAVRVPADVHEQIRRRAKQERLSVNQAIVQAMEQFSGSPRYDSRQEIRDLVDICNVLGAEQTLELRRALAERVKEVYDLDLFTDRDDADAADDDLRAQWEAYRKKKEPFSLIKRNGAPASFDNLAAFKKATLAQRKQALEWRGVTPQDIEDAKKRLSGEDSRRFTTSR